MTGGGHWPTQLFKANQFNDYDVVLQLQNKAYFGADGWGIGENQSQASRMRASK
jgi:hypothetical protein